MDFVSKGKGNKKKNKKRDSSLKVVYISSPMKVKTSASKFRTIVQKLTGRDSDISGYMDRGNAAATTTDFEILPETFGVSNKKCLGEDNDSYNNNNHQFSSFYSSLMDQPQRESPTSSESFLEQSSLPFGDTFFNSDHHMIDEQFFQGGFFPSNLFTDSSSHLDVDVLGSYDAL